MKKLIVTILLFALSMLTMGASNSLQYQVVMTVNGIAKTFYMSDTITNYNVNEGQVTATTTVPFGFVTSPKHIFIYNRDSTITARWFTWRTGGVKDTFDMVILPKQQILIDRDVSSDSIISISLVYSKKTYVYTYVGK